VAAEAIRIAATHAVARFHQRYDLALCPCVPHAAQTLELAQPVAVADLG
jgi:hypothetical protein